MERRENLLTAKEIAGAGPGWHRIGNNLYLRVDDFPDGGKRRRWIVRGDFAHGKKRDFGAGSAERTSLKLARKRRDHILAQLADGLDPVAEKRAARQAAATARNSAHTFGEAAEAVFKNREPGWKRGSSTPAAWVKSINVDCKPLLKMPVGEIGFLEVKAALAEALLEARQRPPVANVLTRIERVLDHAFAQEWATGRRQSGHRTVCLQRPPARQTGGSATIPMVASTACFIAKLRSAERRACRLSRSN